MFDATTFLNVDLDVVSAEDLAPLAEALAPRLHVLHVGRVGRWHRATFELRGQPRAPDAAIRRMVDAIDRLPPRERTRWRRATRRDFDVGIQAALQPHARAYVLAPATVALAARVGARLVFTVYGASLAAE